MVGKENPFAAGATVGSVRAWRMEMGQVGVGSHREKPVTVQSVREPPCVRLWGKGQFLSFI